MDNFRTVMMPGLHHAVRVEALPALDVGPGCTRRDLPSNAGVRAWVVDMAPGSIWPHVDHHDTGEEFYVLSGEVIEGEARYGAGTWVSFAPDSSHRPRSEAGVRLLGLNLSATRARAAERYAHTVAREQHSSPDRYPLTQG